MDQEELKRIQFERRYKLAKWYAERGDYENIEECFWGNKEIMTIAARKSHFILNRIHPNLRKDKEFMLEFVKEYGFAIEEADESLKSDPEMAFFAGVSDIFALKYVDKRFDTKEFIDKIERYVSLGFKIKLRRNKEETLKMIQEREDILESVRQMKLPEKDDELSR